MEVVAPLEVMVGRVDEPNELAVLIAFCKDADEAWLAVEYPSDVLWGDASVEPGRGHSDAHLVFCAVASAAVWADCSSCGATGYLVETGAQGVTC